MLPLHTSLVLAAAALMALSSVSGTPIAGVATQRGSVSTCTRPRLRKEWFVRRRCPAVGKQTLSSKLNADTTFRRDLSRWERRQYLRAIRCLQQTPGKTSATYSGVKSRYDDFLALHISQTDYIHWAGQFLPCGYMSGFP
ncbi:hypothetical protein F4780DRAFT_657749 [Xylariomycetidae sp. FL0641]|nr:hypothetical protein F4780DRAFT_657749 [Xylariomycetidae sp. FL0641]